MGINIAIAGGPCTGKSTLAAALFAALKIQGWDYDLLGEEHRRLKREFGNYRSPFERLYMWRQQEREELRANATDGFITDQPLFHFYVHARQFVSEPRDWLAVRELLRMCLEIADRYQLIVMAEDIEEIPYKTDQVRSAGQESSRERHRLTRSFVEHFWPEKLLLVRGSVEERTAQVFCRLKEMREEGRE